MIALSTPRNLHAVSSLEMVAQKTTFHVGTTIQMNRDATSSLEMVAHTMWRIEFVVAEISRLVLDETVLAVVAMYAHQKRMSRSVLRRHTFLHATDLFRTIFVRVRRILEAVSDEPMGLVAETLIAETSYRGDVTTHTIHDVTGRIPSISMFRIQIHSIRLSVV
jgi:hypothetical protein